jgi:hypothetical protein
MIMGLVAVAQKLFFTAFCSVLGAAEDVLPFSPHVLSID